MMSKRILLQLLVVIGLLLPVFSGAASAQFNPLETSCEGLGDNSAVCNEADNGQTTGEQPLVGDEGILTKVTNILALVAAVIAVIIIIIAGIGMTLSGGDGNKVSNSRNAIIYAAIGIAVIVVARGLVLFIINRIG